MANLTKGETFRLNITARDAVSVSGVFGGAATHTVAGVLESELQLDPATGTQATVWVIKADTTTWAVGGYGYEAWVTFADGSKSLAVQGKFQLVASVGSLSSGTDVRSQIQQTVDNLEAMMAGNASDMVKKYKINNRELERYSTAEILSMLKYWRSRLQSENRKAKGIYGLGPRIETTF